MKRIRSSVRSRSSGIAASCRIAAWMSWSRIRAIIPLFTHM
jgi:hypothetical protein